MRLFLQRWGVVIALVLASAAIMLGALSVTRLASERSQAILTECEAQNARHNSTVAELDHELSSLERHASPTRRAQLEASKAFTILLIDRLAPYQNCQVVLRTLSKS